MSEENKIYIIIGKESPTNKILSKLLKEHIKETEGIKDKNILPALENSLTEKTSLKKFIKDILEITNNKKIEFISLSFRNTKDEDISYINSLQKEFSIKSFEEYLLS
ncbi:hypothetical protein [Candidatus Vampirococcus lugosii]|uniref:Uncharacterized protein n=1 Tax=Candidatus Vampirococcus lugosii TaxID=2789015 RepID=A0ABS5QL08_9BACT|nr:hypothetical protein [Candidatus Vampirococcus lugosii]MBS8121903.1 hypothetical protein [Candidatus Vampirococcus lugosii]